MAEDKAERDIKTALTGLELVSANQDISDMHEFINDEDFSQANELVLKCIADPNPSHASIRQALLLMQAYAFKFRMQSKVYDSLKKGRAGTDENIRKNVYYSASEQCHELAQTLKYLLREQVSF
jgi:hypothetical protein